MAFTKEDERGTIYENTSASGTPYLKLTIKGEKFIAYRNKFKEEDRHPDWKVYVDKPRAQAKPMTSRDVDFD